MKLFFGDNNQPLEEPQAIYLLQFLDETSYHQARAVSKAWRDLIDKSKQVLPLKPYLQRIPYLAQFRLDQMKFTELTEGSTNYMWKVGTPRKGRTGYKFVVLRIPGEHTTEVGIHRGHEAHNAQLASDAGLNAKILFLAADGLQLTTFYKGRSLTPELLAIDGVIPLIAQSLKKVHTLEPFSHSIYIFSRNRDLLQTLKDNDYAHFPHNLDKVEARMAAIEATCQNFQIVLSSSHNDLIPENILVKQKAGNFTLALKILDWEYSSTNDRLWDLVYFIMMGGLTPEQEKQLINCYFEESNETIFAWSEVYKPLVSWWVTLWYWTQLSNQSHPKKTETFEKEANIHYLKTLNHLSSDSFNKAMETIQEESSQPSFNRRRSF